MSRRTAIAVNIRSIEIVVRGVVKDLILFTNYFKNGSFVVYFVKIWSYEIFKTIVLM